MLRWIGGHRKYASLFTVTKVDEPQLK